MSDLPERRRRLAERLSPHYPGHAIDLAVQALRPALLLSFVPAPGEAFAVGQSRRGGWPDLGTVGWPECAGVPMTFLAQFGLAEVARYDEAGLLPSRGLLSFFLSAEAFGSDPAGGYAVLYEPDPDRLRRAPPLPEVPEETDEEPARLVFRTALHLYGEPTPDWTEEVEIFDDIQAALSDLNFAPEEEALSCSFLLGRSADAVPFAEEEEGELALFSLQSSDDWPFLGQGIHGVSFLISGDDLRARDFSGVRLIYDVD